MNVVPLGPPTYHLLRNLLPITPYRSVRVPFYTVNTIACLTLLHHEFGSHTPFLALVFGTRATFSIAFHGRGVRSIALKTIAKADSLSTQGGILRKTFYQVRRPTDECRREIDVGDCYPGTVSGPP